jgi:hypothetical protein
VAVRAPALSYFGKSIEHLSWREESTSSPQWVGYQPSAGDTVRNYRVEDANLPLGLSIDPDTGTISGTFTGLSSARFAVAATITHGNRTIDVRTGVIEPLVLAPSVVYADTTAPTGKVGTAYVLPAPTFDDGSAIGAGYVGLFTIDQSLSGPCQTPGPLPMGLQLNAATGAISGTPTETLSWCFAIKYEVTASDGSSVVGRLRPPIIIVP